MPFWRPSSVPVVAHAEGAGQAHRAVAAGVNSLAHTPWTERLSDEEIALHVSSGCAWISTLDIHGHGDYGIDFDVAIDNLARFHALGGRILYGTDLGNGPLPVGLNRRELEALVGVGLSAKTLLDSLAEHPGRSEFGSRISYIAGAVPTERTDYPAWLATSKVLAASDLKELFS
jgi:imidazolonepropionase-like amidohydrolase